MIRLLARCGLVALFMSTAQGAPAVTAVPAPLRVIASPVPHAEILRFVQTLAPDLPLKIVEIDNALRPNELLARGESDANFFQHVPYLRQQERDLGTQFVVIAAVHIEPLGIYSRKIRSLADLPDKGTVSIPNNVVNLSRALEHDPRIQRLGKLLTSPAVAAFIRERYRGSVIPVTP